VTTLTGAEAVVVGADRTLLRDVTVTNRGSRRANLQIAVLVEGAEMRIENAVLDADTDAAEAYALLIHHGASVDVRDSRLNAAGPAGVAAWVYAVGDLRVRGSELVASGRSWAIGMRTDLPGSAAVVESSAIVSSDTAVAAGAGGTITVGASRVAGGRTGAVTCVGSYSGSFAPLNAGCN
jgi:hypothetical protein